MSSSELILRAPDFSALEKTVREAQRSREALEAMLKILTASDHFDAHDTRSVEETLVEVLRKEKAAREELSRRTKIYNETLRAAQEQVVKRHEAMSQLNDSTEAFELFPELAAKFAQRQSQMIKLVETATQKLEA